MKISPLVFQRKKLLELRLFNLYVKWWYLLLSRVVSWPTCILKTISSKTIPSWVAVLLIHVWTKESSSPIVSCICLASEPKFISSPARIQGAIHQHSHCISPREEVYWFYLIMLSRRFVSVEDFKKRALRSKCSFTADHQSLLDLIKNVLYLEDLNSGNYGLDHKHQLMIVDFVVRMTISFRKKILNVSGASPWENAKSFILWARQFYI